MDYVVYDTLKNELLVILGGEAFMDEKIVILPYHNGKGIGEGNNVLNEFSGFMDIEYLNTETICLGVL